MAQKNSYIKFIERQIAADIEAAKRGALDELTIRERLEASLRDEGPESPFTALNLWLLALVDGVIDDLKVIVKESQKGPKLIFEPSISPDNTKNLVPVIELPIPGPYDKTQQTSSDKAALPG